MTKVDIYSGFLGAGKTTLIKKLLKEAYQGEKVVLIENEFGEIGIDGGFLTDAGVEITEMNSGCICCSLVGDFAKALKKVLETYEPDRIIIEPSGVGKLSDVVKAVKNVQDDRIAITGLITVVDANKCKVYLKNFGEFFENQIENATTVILSHNDAISDEKLERCVSLIREHNQAAALITTPWDKLDGAEILKVFENGSSIEAELHEMEEEHHHADEACGCHHHHDDDDKEDEHEHAHHHHHHDEHEEHEHHHHDEDHDHDHHHHHHADEIFTSWGKETVKKFTEDDIRRALNALTDAVTYGTVLRAKGIVDSGEAEWIYFDYIPGTVDIRRGAPSTVGKICVIGSAIDEDELADLFQV